MVQLKCSAVCRWGKSLHLSCLYLTWPWLSLYVECLSPPCRSICWSLGPWLVALLASSMFFRKYGTAEESQVLGCCVALKSWPPLFVALCSGHCVVVSSLCHILHPDALPHHHPRKWQAAQTSDLWNFEAKQVFPLFQLWLVFCYSSWKLFLHNWPVGVARAVGEEPSPHFLTCISFGRLLGFAHTMGTTF